MGAITRNFANNILGTGQLDATDGVDGNVPAPNVNNESLDNITALPPAIGFGVKTVSSDPPSLNEGEIFFNSTDSVFKALVNVQAWAYAAPMVTPHRDGGFGSSSPTSAAWAAGGTCSTRNLTATEEYNGSGWSSGGSLNTGREEGTGFGLVNAAALAGGSTYPPLALKNDVE